MSLKTVQAPEALEPIFAKAEATVTAFFAQRRDAPAEGRIEIFGERYILVRAAALSVEFFGLVEGLFGPGREGEAADFARNILYDLSHAIARSDARALQSKMGLTDPLDRMGAGPVHFAHSGWASVHVLPESRMSQDEDFYLLYDHPYSFEADAWLTAGAKASSPACIMSAGYSSGWCEESFGLPLVAVEVTCRACGDEACRFIMAPVDRIEAHLARWADGRASPGRTAPMQVPDFFSRKRVEEQLRRREAQYRGIFEATADGLCIATPQGRIVDVNPAFCAMHGYTREELIGQSVSQVILPDDWHLFEACVVDLAGGGSYQAEARHVRRDGAVIPIAVRASLFDYHGSEHLLAVVRDVTEQKQAAEALERQRRFLREVLDINPAGIFVKDTEGRLTLVNAAAAAFYGAPSDALIGRREDELCPHPEQVARWRREDAYVIETGRELLIPCEQVRQRDGSVRYEQTVKRPLADDSGRYTQVIGIVNDITERLRIEEDLRSAKVAAEAANLAKGEFLANMSHELRTPLSGVIGMTQLLLDTQLDGQQAEYVDAVRRSAEAVLAIVNDVLEYSKIEAGKLTLERVPFDLRRVVGEVADLMALEARRHGLQVAVRYPDDLPDWWMGDPSRIRQVLTNFVGNAVKFTPEGSVTLAVERRPGPPGGFPTLRLSVSDTGIGIPSDQLEHIFGRFTQADTKASRRYGGAGLGLAISKTLVDLMGGRVGVESSVGHGSVFWFDLALEPTAPPAPAPSEPAGGGAPAPTGESAAGALEPRARVLLVEDNEINQRVGVRMLERLGCDVVVAANGREALEALSARPGFDLVLMDCQMPELDGYEATAAIRAGAPGIENPRIPIVAMTAHAMFGERERCLAAGMDDYVSKPVTAASLKEMLARWLPRPLD